MRMVQAGAVEGRRGRVPPSSYLGLFRDVHAKVACALDTKQAVASRCTRACTRASLQLRAFVCDSQLQCARTRTRGCTCVQ